MPVKILDTDDFAELRQGGGYYADKTGALERLFSPIPAQLTIFTRPRRFGKTLFLSMLAEFLDITKDSRDLFAGLKISENEALCREWMNQYPVIFLSLKDVDGEDFAEALARIGQAVRQACEKLDFLRESARVFTADRDSLLAIREDRADNSTLRWALVSLTCALERHYGKRAIVLIDDYDVPLANARKRGYQERMLCFMEGFLGSGLKTNFSLKFGILTGCLRTGENLAGIDHASCDDIGDFRYADTFGLGEAEVDTLLDQAGLARKKDEIREWYGGYRFGKTGGLCNPWSILNHVRAVQADPEALPEAWWVNAGANELGGEFIPGLIAATAARRRKSPEDVQARIEEVRGRMTQLWAGRSIAVFLDKMPTYAYLFDSMDNFWTLLYTTGYLTQAPSESGSIPAPERAAILAIPNREVREAFRREIAAWCGQTLSPGAWKPLYRAFWYTEGEWCAALLSWAMLRNMGQLDTLDRGQGESACCGFMLGLFALAGCEVRFGRKEGEEGRVLQVIDEDRSHAAFLAVRKVGTVEELDSAAEGALQHIATQGYDTPLRKEGSLRILHWGLAFCGKQWRARGRLAFLPARP